MKKLCEDTLAHGGSTEIPFATTLVREYVGDTPETLTEHDFNVCTPCAEYLTSNPWMRVRKVCRIMSEADEVEARAQGLITDPVPVGSEKAEPDWTGQTITSIVRAERSVRKGRKLPSFLAALVDEHARLKRVQRGRQAVKELEITKAMWIRGLIDTTQYHAEVHSARKYATGVSLAKRS